MKKVSEENGIKISEENARKIFSQMCDDFGFSIPLEAKTQRIETTVGNVSAVIENEVNNAKIAIEKISLGIIEYNGNSDDPKITYNLKRKVKGISKLEFGILTGAKVDSTKVPLNELNGNMNKAQYESVIMVMTGLSDKDLFSELGFPQFRDLQTIVNYFLA